MKKKLLALLLAGAATLTLAACGGSGGDSSQNGDTPDDKVYKVGISQLVTHDALDAATKGFQDADRKSVV